MKKLSLLCTIALVFISVSLNAQSKKELKLKLIEVQEKQNKSLEELVKLNQDLVISKAEIEALKKENESLKVQNEALSKQVNNNQVKTFAGTEGVEGSSEKSEPVSTETAQCKAITSGGKQCSRKADAGSDYCWQHKSTYEPNSTSEPQKATQSSGYSGGRTIHTGPRGGKYYINSKGKKVYVK